MLSFLLSCSFAVPPVSNIAAGESLVLLPTHASFDSAATKWRVHLHAWVFEDKQSSVRGRLARGTLRTALRVPDDATTRARFKTRVAGFLIDNLGDRTVAVRMGKHTITLGKTKPDGHIEHVHEFSTAEFDKLPRTNDGGLIVQAVLPKTDSQTIESSVTIVSEDGLTVISDIDDTIKITDVTDTSELLANTFHRPFKAVPGMSTLYRSLSKKGAVFHYVSASPWQLRTPLVQFRQDKKYPGGVFHLRRFRIRNLASPAALTGSGKKQETIDALFNEFPKRKFLLFGDSGERDPEIYGKIARKYPDQVLGIFIRNITDEKPTDERFRKAFTKLNRKIWQVFTKAEQITIPAK